MKKLIFTSLLSLSFIVGFAQVVLSGGPNNEAIQDGAVYEISELNYEFPIYVNNNGSETVFTFIKVESIVNNSAGTHVELCYGGICDGNIAEGTYFPRPNPFAIAAGGNNGIFDHIINQFEGDNSEQPVEYVLKFFLVDGPNSTTPIADSEITFTYRYNGSMATQNLTSKSKQSLLKTTVVANELMLNTEEAGKVQVYNMSGALLLNQTSSKQGIISVNSLPKGNYILVFTSQKGERKTSRFIKK